MEKKTKKIIKRIIIAVVIVMAAIAVYFGGALVFINITEYLPADIEKVEVTGNAEGSLSEGSHIKILSWNIGYTALGDNADFFMDGGHSVYTASKSRVKENLSAIVSEVKAENADIVLMQEVDVHSARSYRINNLETISEAITGFENTFAYNFRVKYLPYPFPAIGEVNSGISTWSRFGIASSERIKLPCPFSFPTRAANLKRCLLVDRIPVGSSGKELVIVNLHLEAYDSGEGKIAQTKMLKELLEQEAAKGNYVIAGGDFNQSFTNIDTSRYPRLEGKWQPGFIDINDFGKELQFLMSSDVPSCRSLDRAMDKADSLDPKDFQYYVIDGFIVSSNISVESFEVKDLGFKNSDHNPAVLEVTLD